MHTAFAIALGGALGALCRHYMNMAIGQFANMTFPVGILSINVLGSFLMGVMIAVFAHYWNPPQDIKLFLLTGFLGAFTTFSAFSLDVMTLWSRGAMGEALLYVGGSVVLSVLAIFAGSELVMRAL